MAPRTSTLLPLLAALPYASAWGQLGHTTVAYVAQNFVSAKTATYVQQLLSDTSSAYMANVATWADTYRETSEGRFSAPLHFLDALDSPPKTCNVNYARDCPEAGCIVSAIANYSSRAVQSSVGLIEQQKAMKWVIHFLGDIHQPLHVENLDLGGNTISVTFDGATTNLHASWDTAMPQKRAGDFSQANALAWATTLTTQIKSGAYATESKTWLQGMNAQDALNSSMVWATDTNKFVCTTALPNGPDAVSGQELSGTYYKTAIPVIEKQIAKAGYRLAAWLDAIVTATEKRGEGYVKTGNLATRGTFKLEPWMEQARQARRDFGDDCGCGEDHAH